MKVPAVYTLAFSIVGRMGSARCILFKRRLCII